MDDSIRLRLATRIHFALLRHYGEHVDVGALLKHEATAREALWVCDASGDAEMAGLARQFRHATKAAAKAQAKAAAVPQTMPWSRTSGFGLSRPLELDESGAPATTTNWFKPSTWMKGRSATR